VPEEETDHGDPVGPEPLDRLGERRGRRVVGRRSQRDVEDPDVEALAGGVGQLHGEQHLGQGGRAVRAGDLEVDKVGAWRGAGRSAAAAVARDQPGHEGPVAVGVGEAPLPGEVGPGDHPPGEVAGGGDPGVEHRHRHPAPGVARSRGGNGGEADRRRRGIGQGGGDALEAEGAVGVEHGADPAPVPAQPLGLPGGDAAEQAVDDRQGGQRPATDGDQRGGRPLTLDEHVQGQGVGLARGCGGEGMQDGKQKEARGHGGPATVGRARPGGLHVTRHSEPSFLGQRPCRAGWAWFGR
jgi:hypothetical protein